MLVLLLYLVLLFFHPRLSNAPGEGSGEVWESQSGPISFTMAATDGQNVIPYKNPGTMVRGEETIIKDYGNISKGEPVHLTFERVKSRDKPVACPQGTGSDASSRGKQLIFR